MLIRISMLSLAGVAVYYVYSFISMTAPWPVAVFASVSLMLTYLSLSYTHMDSKRKIYAIYISSFAMSIEVVYGILWNLSIQEPSLFTTEMIPLWWKISLAVLHGMPFSVLLFLVAIFCVSHGQDVPKLTEVLSKTSSEIGMEIIKPIPVVRSNNGKKPQRVQMESMFG